MKVSSKCGSKKIKMCLKSECKGTDGSGAAARMGEGHPPRRQWDGVAGSRRRGEGMIWRADESSLESACTFPNIRSGSKRCKGTLVMCHCVYVFTNDCWVRSEGERELKDCSRHQW